jgi:hypothetical protein
LSLRRISVYAWLTSLLGSHFARVDVLTEHTQVPGVFSFVSDGEVRVRTCPVSHMDTQVVTIIDRGSYGDPPHCMDIH